jgi:Zn-dependent M28 family amino/carboxypeptidase
MIILKKMSLKYIYNNLLIVILSILSGLFLLLTTCTKEEDAEKLRKETITKTLNTDLNADSLQSVVEWMQGMGTRFALSDNRRNVAIKIMKRFKMMGFDEARIDSFMINKTYRGINYQQWQYNVIATLEGNSYPDSICIIGGHYDNNLITGDPFLLVPGANDNASGVAAALEIARVMKKNNYSPESTIEFIAFGAEELGLYGSSTYASDSRQRSKKIRFFLNNDMIAYQSGINKSGWTVNIIDYNNSGYLRREAERMCGRFTLLKFQNDNTDNKQSDSYPFYTNSFKALFFTSNFLDPNYHTLNDLAENCNFEYCCEIVKINCSFLVDKN